jgi:adenylyltransferase/sulfurtransferase
MSFSREELIRWSRHMVLPQIGGLGQARLRAARVIARGEIEALYLEAAGVGEVVRQPSDDGVEAQCLRAVATLKELLAL